MYRQALATVTVDYHVLMQTRCRLGIGLGRHIRLALSYLLTTISSYHSEWKLHARTVPVPLLCLDQFPKNNRRPSSPIGWQLSCTAYMY